MKFTIPDDISVARVVNEDDDFLLLEVIKNEERKLAVEDGDQYYSLLFIHKDSETGAVSVWKPWL